MGDKLVPVRSNILITRLSNSSKESFTTDSGLVVKGDSESKRLGKLAIGRVESYSTRAQDILPALEYNLESELYVIYNASSEFGFKYQSISGNSVEVTAIRAEDVDMIVEGKDLALSIASSL